MKMRGNTWPKTESKKASVFRAFEKPKSRSLRSKKKNPGGEGVRRFRNKILN